MSSPKTETDLKSFPGMVNYLGWYTDFTRNTLWRWDSEHQRAFDGIKRIISLLPILTYFDADHTTIRQSDHTTIRQTLQEKHSMEMRLRTPKGI